MDASSDRIVRVFFGLWPPAEVAQTLAKTGRELQHMAGGRVARPDTIHLTVAFLGDVAPASIERLTDGPITGCRFDLVLDELGVWRHNGIGWIAPAKTPPELLALHDRLGGWLRAEGFALDGHTYRPHVTLVRRSVHAMPPRAIPPVSWEVRDVVLVESKRDAPGARYAALARFPLGRG